MHENKPNLIFQNKGHWGVIQLNRPKALNALSLEMTQGIAATLEQWRHDPNVQGVIMESLHPPAFCAGGDIRALWDEGMTPETRLAFFEIEYQLNATLAAYPKPAIAVMQGITLGGGMGLAMHLPYRIVTEQAKLGMPETGIGFFPDIAASAFLGRHQRTALLQSPFFPYLMGLTGYFLSGEQAFAYGLATHFVKTTSVKQIWETLLGLETISFETIDQALQDASFASLEKTALGEKSLEALEPLHTLASIHFSEESVEDILASLQSAKHPFAAPILAGLSKRAPASLNVTFAYFRHALLHEYTVFQALQHDFALAQSFLKAFDFQEGVDALLIRKDKNPRWNPGSIREIVPRQILTYLSFEDKNLLRLPTHL